MGLRRMDRLTTWSGQVRHSDNECAGGEVTDTDVRSSGAMRALFLVLGALVVMRVVGVILSAVELHGDEAQYWAWSRELAWGYYSKPPLIGWIIATTTGAFGNVEWAVRLAAPIAHGFGALMLGLLGRDLGGPRAGLLAGLIYATMPGIWLSSGVMSTDALLLPLWSTGLFALNRLTRAPGPVWAIALGATIGLGFLAKYAMIYFLLGTALSAVVFADTRRALLSPWGALAGGVAALLLAPNILWNAANDFATVSHTAANANWGGPLFRPGMLGKFLGDQLGVFGPVTMGLLLAAIARLAWRPSEQRRAFIKLLVFVAPPLVIVSAQAFISRANANWAASAYPAACVLVALYAVWRSRVWLAWTAIVMHSVVGLVFAAASLSPSFADEIGLANAFKRARGWEVTTAEVRAIYEAGSYTSVAADNRLLFHGMEYYGQNDPLPLRMWLRYYPGAINHPEQRAPLTASDGDPVLIINERPRELPRIQADFTESEVIGELVIPLGRNKERRLTLVRASGYRPLERNEAYEARWPE